MRWATALCSAGQASPLLSQKVLQRDSVQHRIRQHPLQLGVLVLERLQPLGLRYDHSADAGLPLVDALDQRIQESSFRPEPEPHYSNPLPLSASKPYGRSNRFPSILQRGARGQTSHLESRSQMHSMHL